MGRAAAGGIRRGRRRRKRSVGGGERGGCFAPRGRRRGAAGVREDVAAARRRARVGSLHRGGARVQGRRVGGRVRDSRRAPGGLDRFEGATHGGDQAVHRARAGGGGGGDGGVRHGRARLGPAGGTAGPRQGGRDGTRRAQRRRRRHRKRAGGMRQLCRAGDGGDAPVVRQPRRRRRRRARAGGDADSDARGGVLLPGGGLADVEAAGVDGEDGAGPAGCRDGAAAPAVRHPLRVAHG